MIVKLDIPPKLLWSLSEEAEREGVTVAALLLNAATRPKITAITTDDLATVVSSHDKTIHGLWKQGLCDADIATELNITTSQVARVRQGMKLPAHRRFSPEAQEARLAMVRKRAHQEKNAERKAS